MNDDYDDEDEYYDDEDEGDFDLDFEVPGGNSALRRATLDNPRIHSCPTCKEPNRLTQADVNQGYQCNDCADKDES